MKSNSKHCGLVLSSTFVGLICGLVLTHQQAYAAQTPPVNNQQSQITTVSDNNLNQTAALNQYYSAENTPNSVATSSNVASNTYSSFQTNEITKRDSSLQTTNSDSTAAVLTPNTNTAEPAATETTDTSNNPENNNSANTATSSPTQDTGNSVSNLVAFSDNQANGNSTNTSASSEQQETNIIAQGTWGTSKWDYTQEGDDYILHLHAGTLGTPIKDNNYYDEGIVSLNSDFSLKLTQIVIDPGVIANQNSGGLFIYLYKLSTIQGLENLDTSQVTNMSMMFDYCEKLTNMDVSHFNTSKVTDMAWMFDNCESLTSLDVSHFNTSKVTDMYGMFEKCKSLTNLDLSHFDTSHVTHMDEMFYDCNVLTSLDLSHFDTSHVVDGLNGFDLGLMFYGCGSLNHLVLGPKIKLINQYGVISDLPAVPAAGTKIPGTDKTVTAPYWIATRGYQQGKLYTAKELDQLTGRDQVTTYDWDSQVPYQETIESKLVTRTINVHYPDGQMKIFQDTVHLSRNIKVKADGSKVYGDWSQDQWKSYDAPQIAGYQASQSNIPAQTVDSNTTDTTIDILYEPIAQTIVIQYLDQGQVVGTQKLIGYTGETLIPNYHAPQGYEITSSPQPNITVDATGTQIIQVNVSHKITQSAETLTKTRTINIHLPNATVKTYRQVAVIKRNVAVDQVTGSKTYGPWHNNSWDAMDIPIIEGYTANQNSIAAQGVTAETENETIDIFYVQK